MSPFIRSTVGFISSWWWPLCFTSGALATQTCLDRALACQTGQVEPRSVRTLAASSGRMRASEEALSLVAKYKPVAALKGVTLDV